MQETMTPVISLDATDAARLRAASHAAIRDLEQRFHGQNWREIAPEYFRAHRELGRVEMAAFLNALGIDATDPPGPEAVRKIIATAIGVFLGQEPGDALATPVADGQIYLQVIDCPIYHRLLDEAPLHEQDGMTACSCAVRRSGWYDVLQATAWDELETNMKWGDPVCSVNIFIA